MVNNIYAANSRTLKKRSKGYTVSVQISQVFELSGKI